MKLCVLVERRIIVKRTVCAGYLYLRIVGAGVLLVFYCISVYPALCAALVYNIGQRGIAAVFQLAVFVVRIVRRKRKVIAAFGRGLFI